jgi:hypothetical protein
MVMYWELVDLLIRVPLQLRRVESTVNTYCFCLSRVLCPIGM